MRLDEAITELTPFTSPAVPELRYIQTAVQKVHDHWPDVSVPVTPREREVLAIRLRDSVAQNNWEDARISFVLAAGLAVMDPERRDRPDLEDARSFLIAEVRASRSETFLSGMLAAHLESFVANAPHTRALALALNAARDRMSPSVQRLFEQVPEIIDDADGPRRLAVRIARMTDPFLELNRAGMRNPHGPGFMERAHELMSALVRPELSDRARIDWYVDWLRPPGRDARSTGAEQAIEALTYPWLNTAPSDQLRSHLVEALIEMYGDPRIRSGGVWAGVDPAHMRVIHRWLTREDMRYFTGVVDNAQKNAMWPPRRNFWLQLFEEGRIDAAWVAFSSQAFAYARENMMRQNAQNVDTRFGFQAARPSSNTSLLIMRIGDKIMVDGCHSYRTHVFHKDDPMAPTLFQQGYDCDEIMRASDARNSTASKPHGSAANGGIETWKRWVRDMINSDVSRSRITTPYSRVRRPRLMSRSFTASQRTYEPPPSRRDPAAQTQFDLGNRSSGMTSSRPPVQPAPAPPRVIITPPSRTATAIPGPSAAPAQTLLDLLIRTGPPAAKALLDHFARMGEGKSKTLLSPNAKAGLEWVRTERAAPPSNLRNALTYLLSSMETFGQGPAGIIARATSISAQPIAQVSALPVLPSAGPQRLELLYRHVDAMEAFARDGYVFSGERTLGTALAKLRARNPDLRPAEIHQLQQLYEMLRRDAVGGRK